MMDRSKLLPKTSAKQVYCLTDKDLDALKPTEKPNPRNRSGPPMKLYEKEALERLAIKRWGSLAGLEAERAKRQQKREQRSILAFVQQQGQQAQAGPSADAQGAAGAVPSTGGASGRDLGGQAATMGADAGEGDRWWAGLQRPLAERLCMVRPGQQQAVRAGAGGQYVLYWMQTALRVHENPALDLAVHASHALGLPLVVASFLLASHPYATARRWKFVLEGLRDVQAELRRQGGELLIYLEGHTEPNEPVVSSAAGRQGQPPADETSGIDSANPCQATGAAESSSGSASFYFHPPPGFRQSIGWRRLVQLSEGAAVVVTEEMPVSPHHDWLQALAGDLPSAVELCAVDAACILPMRSVGRSYDRAYAFRAATDSRRRASAVNTYSLVLPAAQRTAVDASNNGSGGGSSSLVGPSALAPFQLSGPAQQGATVLAQLLRHAMPWTTLDLASLQPTELHEALCALVAGCGGVLDQSVPPVAHMVGGSVAGYARWEDFRRRGLALYAARRNNALLRDGVSRLSAYHHWGMVSPFKVAREAALDKSAGASKYLDEFLTWREISFVYCLHHAHQLHSLAALPKWAQQTLARHASDPRSPRPLADLAAGRSGDDWWDAAQHQLVTTGELANNARMTWGKALIPWAPTPLSALHTALHLNHLYALDGGDPASYAGVLWCFGLFDGPKNSEATPITGSIATRPTSRHAQRLNPAAYRALPV